LSASSVWPTTIGSGGSCCGALGAGGAWISPIGGGSAGCGALGAVYSCSVSVGRRGSEGRFASVTFGASLAAYATLVRAISPGAARRAAAANTVRSIAEATFSADSITTFTLTTDAIAGGPFTTNAVSAFSLAANTITTFAFSADTVASLALPADAVSGFTLAAGSIAATLNAAFASAPFPARTLTTSAARRAVRDRNDRAQHQHDGGMGKSSKHFDCSS